MANVLFVCTANICRSPAAEAIARQRDHATHAYASAGFLFDGRPIEPDMAKALAEVGVDASAHVSRIIDDGTIAWADLILTMESRHLQDIAVMSPEAFHRTIPLREAQQRLEGRRLEPAQFVTELEGRKPMSYFDTRWDVEDPYRRSKRRYRKSVEELLGLVDSVVNAIA